MRIPSIIALFVGLALTGCATTNTSTVTVTSQKPSLSLAQEETWDLMIGKWYGSQPTKDGGKKQTIMERSPQGTYKITFRVFDKDGKYKEQAEVGHWGVSGPVYFTMFRGWIKGDQLSPSNPSDPFNYDAYKIIKLNKDVFEYEDYSTGDKYVTKKVPNDFQFPN
tara:strand:+ start:320 stop:814 length:495 start_codon:yes stop_codon:yes gene_type:complete